MVTQPEHPTVRQTVSSVLKRRVVKSAEQRKEDILNAALMLFSHTGFYETTVEDIAEGAGVAKGTIYLYFPSKEHILLALKRQFTSGLQSRCGDVLAEVVELLAAGETLDHRRVIDDIFDAMIDYNVEHRQTLEVVVRQTPGHNLVEEALDLEQDFLQLIAQAFMAASEHGLIHAPDPEMMAYLLNAAIRDNIVTCLCYEKPCDLPRFVRAAKEFLYKALAPSPAITAE